MSIFDTLEKRHHIRKYKSDIVPDEIVKNLLYKAWKITPSKQNFMPYTVSVLGPDKQKEKDIIYGKTVANHKVYEDIGLTLDTRGNPKMEGKYEFNLNPNYAHVVENSHLIIFSQRVCEEPNNFYKNAVLKEGHYCEQCEEDQLEKTAESISFEVGLFASNLTALCLENDIDISYCNCFPKDEHMWKDTPYLWYNTEKKIAHIHSMMSIGYGSYFRYQWLKEIHKTSDDIKPEVDEIVKWI